MTLTNRKDYRNQIYVDLLAVLVGPGLPCVGGFNGQFADFAGVVPAFCVYSRGSDRDLFGVYGEREKSKFFVGVDVFAPFLIETSPAWNEQNSEDALDDVELIVAGWVMANTSRDTGAARWRELHMVKQNGFGSVTDAMRPTRIGGQEYRRERFTLVLDVIQHVKTA